MKIKLCSHPLPLFFDLLNPDALPFKPRVRVPPFTKEQMVKTMYCMMKELEEQEALSEEEDE